MFVYKENKAKKKKKNTWILGSAQADLSIFEGCLGKGGKARENVKMQE